MVIRLNTPGGLLIAALDIVSAMAESPGLVVVYDGRRHAGDHRAGGRRCVPHRRRLRAAWRCRSSCSCWATAACTIYGLGLFETNLRALAILVLGVGLLMAEAFMPGNGAGGVCSRCPALAGGGRGDPLPAGRQVRVVGREGLML